MGQYSIVIIHKLYKSFIIDLREAILILANLYLLMNEYFSSYHCKFQLIQKFKWWNKEEVQGSQKKCLGKNLKNHFLLLHFWIIYKLILWDPFDNLEPSCVKLCIIIFFQINLTLTMFRLSCRCLTSLHSLSGYVPVKKPVIQSLLMIVVFQMVFLLIV